MFEYQACLNVQASMVLSVVLDAVLAVVLGAVQDVVLDAVLDAMLAVALAAEVLLPMADTFFHHQVSRTEHGSAPLDPRSNDHSYH